MHVLVYVYDVSNLEGMMMIKAEVQLGDPTPAYVLSFIIKSSENSPIITVCEFLFLLNHANFTG